MRYEFYCLSCAVLFIFFGGCASNKTSSDTAEKMSDARLADLGSGICKETTASGLMWVKQPSPTFQLWEDAAAYAEGLQLQGYDDWRLPTKNELHRLHDIFFWKKNGDCNMQTSGSYWWGSEKANAGPGHWETYFLCSPEFKFVETPGNGMVRAVRP